MSENYIPRNIPWKQIVEFHQEICIRAEEDFFSLPIENHPVDRWTSLVNVNPFEDSFFKNISEENLVNKSFIRYIKSGEIKSLFLGGPCFFVWKKDFKKKFRLKWQPFVYMEFNINYSVNGTFTLTPAQGYWEVSPLVYKLLENINFADSKSIEDIVKNLLDKTNKIYEEDKSKNPTKIFIDIICNKFSDFSAIFDKDFPNDRFNEPKSKWCIFLPPSSSNISKYLLRDYKLLLDELKNKPDNIGGLSLLEDTFESSINKDIDVLPIVPLNKSQLNAVIGILKNKPVTVVSGPPGCGKSQVVLSVLLNSWAKGLRVLFASNNNQAVDVVRKRLQDFEEDFPIAIRAGSKNANNLEEALRQTLNYISGKNKNSTEISKDIEIRKQALLANRQNLENYIDSKIPERINEAVSSALNAYVKYKETCNNIDNSKISLNERLENLGYDLSYSKNFEEDILIPLHQWIKSIDDTNKLIIEDSIKLKKKSDEIAKYTKLRNIAVHNIGLETDNIDHWNWLEDNTGVVYFENWLKNLRNFVQKPIENDLEVFDWSQEYDFWKSSEEVIEWIKRCERYLSNLDKKIAELLPILNRINDLLVNYNEHIKIIKSVDIPVDISVDDTIINEWTKNYISLTSLPPSKFYWLPWSEKSKNIRALKRIEKEMWVHYPVNVWKKIGLLNIEGRNQLADIVDKTKKYQKIKNEWENYESIRKKNEEEFIKLRTSAAELGISDIPDKNEIEIWNLFSDKLEEKIKIAFKAKSSWLKKEKFNETQSALRKISEEFYSITPGNPLKETWLNNLGKDFSNRLKKISDSAKPSDVSYIRQVMYTDIFDSIFKNWKTANENYLKILVTQDHLKNIPTLLDRVLNWINKKNDKIKFIYTDVSQLPLPDSEIYKHLTDCKKWNSDYLNFQNRILPDLNEQKKNELNWATEKLTAIVEIIPENSKKKNIYQELQKVIQNDNESWSLSTINKLFIEFNPEMLKARIDHLSAELENLSFDLAKNDWLERMQKNIVIQKDLDKLFRHYRRNKGRIEENAFPLFENALKAIPIWITTAQSPQSIPLIENMFDLVVIDEATQCTLTNLLPLIFRAKRLAVIGDPDQLPAISSIGFEAERAMALKYDIDDQIELLGHVENDVFKVAVKCLPRRRSDVISLNEHYRSHPLIIGFSNQNVYHRNLILKKGFKTSESSRMSGIFGVNVRGVCTRGQYNKSWQNENEAQEVCNLVQSIKDNDDYSSMTIGIVTPFKAHADLILDKLDNQGLLSNITVGTAHKFQGDERDIMIFSTVIAKGITGTAAQWVETPQNLINVAVTRAREKLIVVSDYQQCRRLKGILGKLIQYVDTVSLLRKTSNEELLLFSHMVMLGWNPEVHKVIVDIEVDFVIEKTGKRLVIEVDGSQHKDENFTDNSRDAMLQSRGYVVLRISTREVRETPHSVLNKIKNLLMIENDQ